MYIWALFRYFWKEDKPSFFVILLVLLAMIFYLVFWVTHLGWIEWNGNWWQCKDVTNSACHWLYRV
jgi:hypothetical protein